MQEGELEAGEGYASASAWQEGYYAALLLEKLAMQAPKTVCDLSTFASWPFLPCLCAAWTTRIRSQHCGHA